MWGKIERRIEASGWAIPKDPVARQILWLFLAGDLLFLALHLALFARFLSDVRFSIETDQGFAEIFQYLKEYWAFLIFGWMAVVRRQSHYAAWSLLFGYVLLDDWLMLHEQAGFLIASTYHFTPIGALRDRDLGEFLFIAVIGGLLMLLLLLTYVRADATARRVGREMAVILIGLAACGVGLDLLHQFCFGTPVFGLVGMMEDGGEMLIMSLACAYAISLRQQAIGRPVSLGTLAQDQLHARV